MIILLQTPSGERLQVCFVHTVVFGTMGDGYWFIDIDHPVTLRCFSFTIFSPRFTDWPAVGCEMPSRLESFRCRRQVHGLPNNGYHRPREKIGMRLNQHLAETVYKEVPIGIVPKDFWRSIPRAMMCEEMRITREQLCTDLFMDTLQRIFPNWCSPR